MQKQLLVLFFVCLSWHAFGQPGPPPDPDVPISGIELLLLAGGALGLKKYFSSEKKKER
ncbi:MAG: hypothetical protein MUC38_14260 [Cyclobacteriaceae bacterium]|jgi:hypothetical protein|nr:hypothetical protein [Cyclobacteriaceae bacterium]